MKQQQIPPSQGVTGPPDEKTKKKKKVKKVPKI